MSILVLHLIEKIRSVSLGLFIKYNHDVRVILLSLYNSSRVSFARLPFKDQEGLVTKNSIYEDSNL